MRAFFLRFVFSTREYGDKFYRLWSETMIVHHCFHVHIFTLNDLWKEPTKGSHAAFLCLDSSNLHTFLTNK